MTNRRTFIGTMLGAGAALALGPKLTLTEPVILKPGDTLRLAPFFLDTTIGQVRFDDVPIGLRMSSHEVMAYITGEYVIEAVETFTVTRMYARINFGEVLGIREVTFPFPGYYAHGWPLTIERGNTLTIQQGDQHL